jgi:hypothetical protein
MNMKNVIILLINPSSLLSQMRNGFKSEAGMSDRVKIQVIRHADKDNKNEKESS